MKIAIPTDDGKNISAHFGRCRQFLIYEIRDKKMISRTRRDNIYCPHWAGLCPKVCKDGDELFMKKIKDSTLSGIRDCQLLIGSAINPVLMDNLKKHGIDFMEVDEKVADEAIDKYLLGALVKRVPAYPSCQSRCRLTCFKVIDGACGRS